MQCKKYVLFRTKKKFSIVRIVIKFKYSLNKPVN